MKEERWIDSTLSREDRPFELPLRPQTLGEFIGQVALRERLGVMVEAALGRGEPMSHTLLAGPPGLGKTTLAAILARAMGGNFVATSGAVIDKPADLAGVLTNLQAGDALFIDEIHRLPRSVEEYLYPAMEDFTLDLVIDSGPHARSVQITLNPFTLIGATTRTGLLSSPLRSRFHMTFRLDYYRVEELVEIVRRSAQLLGFTLDSFVAEEVARRSRGTPRIANNLLRWVRDYIQTRSEGRSQREVALEALTMLEIDELGLDEMDKKILTIILEKHNGGPVGLEPLAHEVGEEKETLASVYEPYLILLGFLRRTPRGREVTPLAEEHLKRVGGLS